MAAEPVRKRSRDADVAVIAAPTARQPVHLPEIAAPAVDALGKRRRRIARVAGGVASIAIFGLSLFVLAHTLAKINFADLRGAIAGTTAE
ncbi:MAG: hypothetical protein JO004_14670, partial [Methylobacteriaceae bacterium]|nr:hypothetical protein [Methylobacteriaceae bacterium]